MNPDHMAVLNTRYTMRLNLETKLIEFACVAETTGDLDLEEHLDHVRNEELVRSSDGTELKNKME